MTRRTRIMIAAAVLAAALVASAAATLIVGYGRSGSSAVGDGDSRLSREAAIQSATEAALGSQAGTAPEGTEAEAGSAGDFAAAVPPASAPAAHHLLRTGDLSLLVARGALPATVDRITSGAAALGGYVMSSALGGGSSGPIEPFPLDTGVAPSGAQRSDAASALSPDPYATVVVRVPEQRFETAIERFSRLGDVRSLSTSSEDVTAQYVDVRARLRHYRAVETRLVGFLQETATVNQMLAVQDRIDGVQLTIEELTAQLKSMREQTTYGTLSVYVAEKDVSAAVHRSNTFGGTFWNSVTLLRDGVRVTGLALTALLPFLVVAGVVAVPALYFVRRLRRSRRRPAQPTQPA